ncbi:hypothetical protein [Streptomyces sp. NRRL WC-3742]|uniref:hypothetical protein n=1 Tax=Streptomyces sp. NRRL WC-3742 TaxID=1463934 RepID=UPI0004CB0F4F|nr:hypothetical protein [Streptomyces sp. NRRL WC-3742]
MTTTELHHPELSPSDTRRAFRTVRGLLLAYAGLSAATLAVAFLLRDHTDLVTPSVWVRGTIVTAGAVVTVLIAGRVARGSRSAFQRLRIISGAMLAATVVIIALPGTFPAWFKAEQGLCGLALLGVAAVLNGRHLRTLFARL